MIYYGNVLEYIHETPDILKKLWKQRKEIFGEVVMGVCAKKAEAIYITGSGSSYHAAVTAQPLMQKLLKLPIRVQYPAFISENIDYLQKNSLVIGISQEGRSVSTIHALDDAKRKGCFTVAMTGELSEIVGHSEKCIYIPCGIEDAGATTKGYTATAATLMVFAIELAIQLKRIETWKYQELGERLLETADHMPDTIKACEEWYERNEKNLLSCKNMVIVGYGNQIGTVLEGTLKVTETCRFSVRGFELEEFFHGIYNSIDDDVHLIYLASPGSQRTRILRLYEYYKDKITYNYVVNAGKADNSNYPQKADNRKERSEIEKINRIDTAENIEDKDSSESKCDAHSVWEMCGEKNLAGCFVNDKDFSPLEYILFFQILIFRLSKALGINMNILKDPHFHEAMASKTAEIQVLGFGDNTVDKYEDRGKMYPGGNCLNYAVFAKMNGASRAAYKGYFGTDKEGAFVADTLKQCGVDISSCRFIEGENGYASLKIVDGERIFTKWNDGGVSKETSHQLTEDDRKYVQEFDLVHSALYAYTRDELKEIRNMGVKISYDFSNEATQQDIDEIAPLVDYTFTSFDGSIEEAKEYLKKIAQKGTKIAVCTLGKRGSIAYAQGQYFYQEAKQAEKIVDTNGCGDSYIAAFTVSYLKSVKSGEDSIYAVKKAMEDASVFASKVVTMEGCFGISTSLN